MGPNRRRYLAWLLLSAVFAVHITDEAATHFLDLWNPAVAAMGMPALQFAFPIWITLLALAVIGSLIASHWVRRGTWWTIPASYAFAALMFSNGAAHLIFAIHRHAWVSGSITSPLLLIASLNLWLSARASLTNSLTEN